MRRRKTTIFFVVFGILLTAFAVALNVGWILLNLQQIALLVFGIIFFAAIITGLILNMIFLVREIRRNEQQNAFLNAVTHELKTPIASIRLYLETIKTRDLTEEKRDEFYDIMLSDTDRLLGTVEQVLQASRAREKHRSLDVANLNLESLIKSSAEIVRSRYNLESNAIRIVDPEKDAWVSGDQEEIITVFTNLFDNAVKYSVPNQARITVKTRKHTTGTVDVHIKDNGIGISGQDIGRVFKRFYRAQSDNSHNAKGTGLGLFIVESILKKHGGKVSVRSKGRGEGSTFTVRLPLVKEKPGVN